MRKLPLEKLDRLFDAIEKSRTLYIPTGVGSDTVFARRKPGMKLSESLQTIKSPKEFFFPQAEALMGFKVEGKHIEVLDTRSECEDFVIFGVRACDARALEVLDRVFLAEPVDSYYKNRREHGIIITLGCQRPSETCFCSTFGIDPAAPGGDIEALSHDRALYLEARTERGGELLASLEALTEPCDRSECEPCRGQIRERMSRLPLSRLKADAFGGGKTDVFFDSPEWERLSESCLGCGSCTYHCPTCQCYDIKDFETEEGIVRRRLWDSCMYSEFTKMSAGQPRLTKKARFRQRFMHKLVYYPENNGGLYSCVGCGRCLKVCPIGMNIVRVMKTLGDRDLGPGGKA